MGRYAFFNTGFEYKFGFGIQSSMDMTNFFGTSYYGKDVNSLVHVWKKTDDKLILERLNKYPYEVIDITKYKKSINGTYKLQHDLEKICDNLEYILGNIIYHQLQYTDELRVNFEL